MVDAGEGHRQKLQGGCGLNDRPRIGIVGNHDDVLTGAALLEHLRIGGLGVIIMKFMALTYKPGGQFLNGLPADADWLEQTDVHPLFRSRFFLLHQGSYSLFYHITYRRYFASTIFQCPRAAPSRPQPLRFRS
ncbi:hypothetical protein SDC9_173079 [bioreactor metagenome]|uniref:Uncharacterized protein n=1 Tax=bioreactor metagenome TaxID=1076179 RepID=A0A645GFH9_9ZZZZ